MSSKPGACHSDGLYIRSCGAIQDARSSIRKLNFIFTCNSVQPAKLKTLMDLRVDISHGRSRKLLSIAEAKNQMVIYVATFKVYQDFHKVRLSSP